MLVKVLAAIMFIITMSHMNGMVPGDVFKKNVDNTRNRTMLTIVDDALVNHFCNSGGQLPETLDGLMALGVKENLDDNFGYTKTGENTYNLWIKGTKEFSANSGRDLTSNVFNYTKDENGQSIFVGKDSIMHALITYNIDAWTGHVVGIDSIACDVWYEGDRDNASDAYVADFSGIRNGRDVLSVLANFMTVFYGAEEIATYDRACDQDGEIIQWLFEELTDDIKKSWTDPEDWWNSIDWL